MNIKKVSKYDTLTRCAISDAFVRCSKQISGTHRKLTELHIKLEQEKDTLSYKRYIQLQKEYDAVLQELHDLKIQRDTWDEAREICLNIIDSN